MTTSMMPSIKSESFTLESSVSGRGLIVRFTGNGDMSAIDVLDRYLKQIETELVALASKEAVIDLRDLYFMNSSCIKSFVSWIYRAKTTNSSYSIRFLTNPRQHWQANTLASLQRLAPSLVFIDNAED